ncbi:hypothetical protein V5F77_06175 [Xanthobacter sp. DSM 24535]|uniref:hypothetical protein n=1 Tax=Roseixanthobacter psychrophilus TaxID=3119917 RepID=UPI0037262531
MNTKALALGLGAMISVTSLTSAAFADEYVSQENREQYAVNERDYDAMHPAAAPQQIQVARPVTAQMTHKVTHKVHSASHQPHGKATPSSAS